MRRSLLCAFFILIVMPVARPQSLDSAATATLERAVRADMGFLADDELRGWGTATRDEHLAAL